MNPPSSPPPAAVPVGASALEQAATSPSLPAIVAGAFERLNLRSRARMLGRLLPSVGPLAMAAIAGGAFAKYIEKARWPEIPKWDHIFYEYRFEKPEGKNFLFCALCVLLIFCLPVMEQWSMI